MPDNDNEQQAPEEVRNFCQLLGEAAMNGAEEGDFPLEQEFEFCAIYDLIDPPVPGSHLLAPAYVVTVTVKVEGFTPQ